MKKILCLSLMLAFCMAGRAQDVLVTESGDAIKAWGVDIAGSKIYYREAEAEDSPLKSINKASVLMWKKADGSRVLIGQEEQKTAAPAAAKAPAANIPAPDASDPEANQLALAQFNASDISPTKEQKSGASTVVTGILRMTPQSVIADKNVELVFHRYSNRDKGFKVDGGMTVTAKNKTDKTIYFYLGNTFFLRHGVATPFNTSSASQAAKDGQGAVATGFSQSVIAVPAQSSLDLGSQLFFTKDKYDSFGKGFYYYDWGYRSCFEWTHPKSDAVNKNESREYAPGQFPIDFGFKVTYSFSEDNTQLYHLDADFYTAKIIGCQGYDGWGRTLINYVGEPLWYQMNQVLSREKGGAGRGGSVSGSLLKVGAAGTGR